MSQQGQRNSGVWVLGSSETAQLRACASCQVAAGPGPVVVVAARLGSGGREGVQKACGERGGEQDSGKTRLCLSKQLSPLSETERLHTLCK